MHNERMPILITTHRHLDDPTAEFLPNALPGVHRRAVATLEEARTAVCDVLRESARNQSGDEWHRAREMVVAPAWTGGTIKLPDGTVIEIEAVEWPEIAKHVSPHVIGPKAIIDAYNAA